ncbi:MAG: hypothetical protein AB7E46_05175 [Desulfovibrio sp.]|jgi:hypothetical protein
MTRHPNRPRAIALAAPAPYVGPGHLVIIAAMAVLALLLFSGLTKAHATNSAAPADALEIRADAR